MQQQLNGRWYLTYTTFAMWKHDKIGDVTFNYTQAKKNGSNGLLDEVKYVEKGKNKCITGFDFIDKGDPNKLLWQGKGWMFWIKCPWKIEWSNEEATCVILSFERTLVTASGIDIISRFKEPGPAVLEEAFAFIRSKHNLQKWVDEMVKVLQH